MTVTRVQFSDIRWEKGFFFKLQVQVLPIALWHLLIGFGETPQDCVVVNPDSPMATCFKDNLRCWLPESDIFTGYYNYSVGIFTFALVQSEKKKKYLMCFRDRLTNCSSSPQHSRSDPHQFRRRGHLSVHRWEQRRDQPGQRPLSCGPEQRPPRRPRRLQSPCVVRHLAPDHMESAAARCHRRHHRLCPAHPQDRRRVARRNIRIKQR